MGGGIEWRKGLRGVVAGGRCRGSRVPPPPRSSSLPIATRTLLPPTGGLPVEIWNLELVCDWPASAWRTQQLRTRDIKDIYLGSWRASLFLLDQRLTGRSHIGQVSEDAGESTLTQFLATRFTYPPMIVVTAS